MISFKAHLIQHSNIQKRNSSTGKFENYKVQMAELEPVSTADLNTLKNITEIWGGEKNSFVGDICNDFDNFFQTRNEEPNKRFFVLTEQKRRLEKLKADDILACAEITQRTKNKHEINYLEVCPLYVHSIKGRPLKRIGSAMLESIKALLPNKDIVLNPSVDGVECYLRNGFEWLNGVTMIFRNEAKKAKLK